MRANLLPSIFTIEIGGGPTLVFEARIFARRMSYATSNG